MLNNGCAIKYINQRGELKKTLSYRGFYFVILHSLFYYSIVQNDFFQVVIEKLPVCGVNLYILFLALRLQSRMFRTPYPYKQNQ